MGIHNYNTESIITTYYYNFIHLFAVTNNSWSLLFGVNLLIIIDTVPYIKSFSYNNLINVIL